MKSAELKRTSSVGDYIVSMAVVPSLLMGTPVAPGNVVREPERPRSSAISAAGSNVEMRWFLASEALRSASLLAIDPNDITLQRTPKQVRRISARVVKRKREPRLADNSVQLDDWIGGQDV